MIAIRKSGFNRGRQFIAVNPSRIRCPAGCAAYVAIVVGAFAAGVPVAMILHGIDAYIERQARDETRLAAQRAIARAEWRIGQSIAALDASGERGLRLLRRRRSRTRCAAPS